MEYRDRERAGLILKGDGEEERGGSCSDGGGCGG